MDNQQKRLLYWLAGLIDGEGCFYISYRSRKLKTGEYQIIGGFTLAMTDKDTIDTAKDIIEKYIKIVPYLIRYDGLKKGYRVSYQIRITSLDNLKIFLELMKDRFITKKYQANLLLQYVNSRRERINQMKDKGGAYQSTPYSQNERKIAEEIRSINSPKRRIPRDYTLNA